MTRLLTVRKERWRQNFKPEVLRGDPLSPNMSVAARYRSLLDSLIDQMIEETTEEIRALFKDDAAQEFFATDASVSSQARKVTNMLMEKYKLLFGRNAKWMAESLAKHSDKASSKSVHMSIQKLSGGLSLPTAALNADLKEIFKAVITENVALIKSIPEKYLNGVQQAVMRSITTGEGMKQLVPYLQKHKGITYARAKTISLDQTRKAFQAMSAERVKRLGVKKFEWRHVPSNHPRSLHKDTLNGRIFKYDDPPVIDKKTGERGFPGQLINCRCMAVPVIEFEE